MISFSFVSGSGAGGFEAKIILLMELMKGAFSTFP